MTNEELRNYFEKATISSEGGAEGYIKAAKVRTAVLELIDKNTFLLSEIENLKKESIYIELQSAYNTARNIEKACRNLQEENEQLKSDMKSKRRNAANIEEIFYTTHELKTWPEYFEGIQNGEKQFELRKDDRRFKVGDMILLREYKDGIYTGRKCERRIKYILRNCTDLGLMPEYCILGL